MEARMEAILPYAIQDVWEVVTNNEKTAWRTDIVKVEVMGDTFIEYTKQNFKTTFHITKKVAEKQYEFDLSNINMIGHWIGNFERIDENHTKLELIEQLTVKNKVMRMLAPFYLKSQQKKYLRDLKKELERKNND